LVDASLRSADWYLQYFADLRKSFPALKIAVISVEADVISVLDRVKHTALSTGRLVPEQKILHYIKEAAHVLRVLGPQTDFYARLANDDASDPVLLDCELHLKTHPLQPSSRRNSHLNRHHKDSQNEITDWTLHRKDQSSLVEVFQDDTEKRDQPFGIYALTTVIKKRPSNGYNPSSSSSSDEEESTSRTQQGTSDDENTLGNNTRQRKNSNASRASVPVPILPLAERVLQNPQQPKERQKKQKKSRQVSPSAPKDEAFSSISVAVEQTVIDVDDWYPYFANVWSMKCGQLPHGGRLKRLATLKELSVDLQADEHHSLKADHKSQEIVKKHSLLISMLNFFRATWSRYFTYRYAKVGTENE
jgi:hypothetical protein